jgi:small-conductance mechanosensitive channel
MPLTLNQITNELCELWEAMIQQAKQNKELRQVVMQQQHELDRLQQKRCRPAPPPNEHADKEPDDIDRKRQRLNAILEGMSTDSEDEETAGEIDEDA